jgi:hypothetical protein
MNDWTNKHVVDALKEAAEMIGYSLDPEVEKDLRDYCDEIVEVDENGYIISPSVTNQSPTIDKLA